MWSRVSLAWSRLLLRWARRRWPRVPLWTRRTWLNVAGSVLSVLVAVAAVLVAILAGKGHSSDSAAPRSSPRASARSSAGATTPPIGPTLTDLVAPTSSTVVNSGATATGTGALPSDSSTPAASLTEAIARQAVVAYLNAVNARNRVQAGGLICQSLLPTWLQNVDSPNSDFDFTITEARFTGSAPVGGGSLFLHYTLVFNDHTTNDVDFTVIDENGPKICGEQKV